MQLNYIAILIATAAQFIVGFVWYGPIFGKLWAKIHDCDKLSKAELQKMQKAMMPFYGVQLILTLITTFILAILLSYVPDWNVYALAGFLWLGFVVPTQASSVIFGGTEGKWILKKIAIQAGASIICLEVAALILHFMM